MCNLSLPSLPLCLVYSLFYKSDKRSEYNPIAVLIHNYNIYELVRNVDFCFTPFKADIFSTQLKFPTIMDKRGKERGDY